MAKIIWPTGRVTRSPLVDGLERDAIIQTPDMCFVIEASTSRKQEKAEYDAKKTDALVKKLRRQGFAAQGVIVRLHEPSPEQEIAVKKFKSTVTLETFEEFSSRLFDAASYLQVRLTKPFGSILDPSSRAPKHDLDRHYYVDIPIIDDNTHAPLLATDLAVGLKDRAARFVMVADFGSGKSMAMREVFHTLRDAYLRRVHSRCPIYINLRDHSGARYPDEIFERHARDLGIKDPQELLRAWRAGFVDLILDGFDEFAPTSWSSAPLKLQQVRQVALEAVRKVVTESSAKVGILISGRQHYFDSPREMNEALGTQGGFQLLRIDTLTEETARSIVKKYGGGDVVPDWVPSRALLLSYLAAQDFLKEAASAPPAENPRGHGWDALLQMIGEREARQHQALVGRNVVEFLERLATLARASSDGLGSFSESELSTVFQETCGFPADDIARVFISRLPALANVSPESGRRRFLDPDIADAARAGDVFRLIESPYGRHVIGAFSEAQCLIGDIGVDRLSYLVDHKLIQPAQIEVAAEHARKSGGQIPAIDLVQLLSALGLDYTRSPIGFTDINFRALSFENDSPDLSRVSLWGCTIEAMFLAPEVDSSRLPRFENCLIGSLDGVSTPGDLPSQAFSNCEIFQFSSSLERNAGILAADLPLATKVLLTILNKLFNQAGSGRKENAFVRGLDTRAAALVPDVLNAVRSLGFASPSRLRKQIIWLPRRDKAGRAFEIMNRPASSEDPLLQRIRQL